MSGHVFLLVPWFTFNLYMSLFARALPHHLALGRLCLSTSGGERRGFVRMCVDIAVCVQRGLLIGELEVWQQQRSRHELVRINGRAVSE